MDDLNVYRNHSIIKNGGGCLLGTVLLLSYTITYSHNDQYSIILCIALATALAYHTSGWYLT